MHGSAVQNFQKGPGEQLFFVLFFRGVCEYRIMHFCASSESTEYKKLEKISLSIQKILFVYYIYWLRTHSV